ncbi:unnamed protein product, partial [Brassica rapa]
INQWLLFYLKGHLSLLKCFGLHGRRWSESCLCFLANQDYLPISNLFLSEIGTFQVFSLQLIIRVLIIMFSTQFSFHFYVFLLIDI